MPHQCPDSHLLLPPLYHLHIPNLLGPPCLVFFPTLLPGLACILTRARIAKNHRPKKAPRVEGSPSSSAFVSAKGHPQPKRGAFGSPRPIRGSPLSGKGKAPAKRQASSHPLLPEPVHDLGYIKATYMTQPLKPEWEANPKSPLSNYFLIVHGGQIIYENAQYLGPSGLIFRYVQVVLCRYCHDIQLRP